MADPLTVLTNLVNGILSRVRDAKTNEEDCKALASMAKQTLLVMKTVEANELSDPCATKAIELIHEALKEADEAVEKCCGASFFSAWLWPESYSMPLNNAFDKVKHALDQVPLASTSMTADMQSHIFALHEQLSHAQFNERAAITHQTIALREELEKGFHQNVQEFEEIKDLIGKLAQEQFSSQEKLKKELATLRRNAHEAHASKEKLEEYALNQIIAVIAESLGDVHEVPTSTQNLKESLCCPISKEIMKDPVLVKDSGIVYDRASIIEWFERGHHCDPLTNVELISRDIIRCHALREVSSKWTDESGNSSALPKDIEGKDQKPCLSPGLYKGFGKLLIDSSTIHVNQTLVLEPNGRVLSYSLYKKSNGVIQRNGLEIGGGEWDDTTLHLSFGDQWYGYHGNVSHGATHHPSRIDFKGHVSEFEMQGAYDCVFSYSPPRLQHRNLMHPRLLQMESEVIQTQSNVQYIGKILLCLEMDFSVCGWMWFGSTMSQSTKTTGRIVHGRWEAEGTLKFSVYFPLQNTLLDSEEEPTNECAAFRVEGRFDSRGRLSRTTFTSVIRNTSDDDMIRDKNLSFTPLDGIKRLEFFLMRVTSTPWHHCSNNVRLFRTFTNYEAEASKCINYKTLSICYGLTLHSQPALRKSPLHIAAENNFVYIVKELITKGGDIDLHDRNGKTLLHCASYNNSIDVAKMLIENGTTLDLQDNDGETPLHQASYNNSIDVAQILVSKGASIHIEDNRRQTPLHHASSNNSITIVEMLIDRGVDINLQDNKGRTPLHQALENDSIDVAKMLIDRGADVSLQDDARRTPLHQALDNNSIDIAKMLIDKGVDINLHDIKGRTPLHQALDNNSIDIAKILIEKGAKINLQDNEGISPLNYAIYKNLVDVAKILFKSPLRKT